MGAAPVLKITRNGETVASHELKGESVVGRAENCEIRLEDRGVSREHAILRLVGSKADQKVEIRKRSQFAPLLINGNECTSAILKMGDCISMGPFQMRLEDPHEASHEAPHDRPGSLQQEGVEQRESTQTGSAHELGPPPAAVDFEQSPASDLSDDLKNISMVQEESHNEAAASPQETPEGEAGAHLPFENLGNLQENFAKLESEDSPRPDFGLGITLEPPQEAHADPQLANHVDSIQMEGQGDAHSESHSESQVLEASIDQSAPEIPNGQNQDPQPTVGTLTAAPDPNLDDAAVPENLFDAPDASQMGPATIDTSQFSQEQTKVSPMEGKKVVLVIPKGLAQIEQYVVEPDKDEVSIGRDEACDIVLNDKKASRKHAIICRSGNQFIIKDLESSNGTRVNGNRIVEQELTGDDKIRIGNVDFLFQIVAPDYQFDKQTQDRIEGFSVSGEQSELDSQMGQVGSIPETPSMQVGGEIPLSPGGSEQGFQSGPLPEVGLGPVSTGQPFDQIPPVGESAEPSKKKKSIFIHWITDAPPRQRAIRLVLVLGIFYLIFFDDDLTNSLLGVVPQEQSQIKVKAKKAVDPTAPKLSDTDALGTKPEFDSLNPEQKKFVQGQLEKGMQKLQEGDYDGSLFELEKIFAIVSDYKNAKEIQRYARDKKRLAELQKEEERKRQEAEARKAELAALAATIGDALSKKQIDVARENVSKLLGLDPENPQGLAWKKEIEEWDLKEQERAKQEEVRKLVNDQAWSEYKKGLALKKAGKWFSAIEVFKGVEALSAQDRSPAQKSKTAIAECKREIAAIRDPLLADAKSLEQGGQNAKAYQKYKQVFRVDPTSREAGLGLERTKRVLRDRAKINYTEAVLAESYSDFGTAIKKYREIIASTPEDDQYFESATRKLSRLKLHPSEEHQDPSLKGPPSEGSGEEMGSP